MTTATLEETIRQLAARGEISNISLAMNGSHTRWRACFVPCSTFGQSFAEDEDPIKALMTALTTVKLKTRKPRTLDDPRVEVIPQETQDANPDADIDALM
jgi:hypothetical protein